MRPPSSFRTLALDTLGGRVPVERLAERWRHLPSSPVAFRRLLAVEECAADLLVRVREVDLISVMPREHADLLESRAVRQTSRMLALRSDLREVLGALHARNIIATVLKGAAFECAGLRPLRVCNDLDLMIAHSDVPAALTALESVGYHMDPGERLPPDFHHLPPLHRHQSVPVELHTRLLFRGQNTTHTLQRVAVGAPGLRVLAPTEWVWHLLAHDSHHHETAGNVRSALDLSALDTRYPSEIDWREIARRCRSWPDPVAPLLASFRRVRGRRVARISVTMQVANAALSAMREYAARVAVDDDDFVFAVHKLAGALIASPTGWVGRRRLRKDEDGQGLPSIPRDAARLARILLAGPRAARAS